MAFCTISQVRESTDKIDNVTDVPDIDITGRIAEADKVVVVDLSSLYTQAQLESLGSSNLTLNLMSTYKSVELVLIKIYGAARQADQVSDIDYWRKRYAELLKRVLTGEITLIVSTSAPVDVPVITPARNRLKLFPTKGICGVEQGSVEDGF